MKKYNWLIVAILFATSGIAAQERIWLSGKWEFAIDRKGVGIEQSWFNKTFDDSIRLPGSMPENLKGDDITLQTPWEGSIYDSSYYYNPRLEKYRIPGHLKIPFFLTPNKHYIGWAWYGKTVSIPASWKGKRIVLHLERPHVETVLWVNGQKAGEFMSHCVPHEYDVSAFVKTGENRIVIAIDNTTKAINVGKDSHSITDQTQGNWNGIVGDMYLEKSALLYFDDIQIFPDITAKKALIRMTLNNSSGKTQKGVITLSAKSFNSETIQQVPAITVPFTLSQGSHPLVAKLPMGDNVLLWDEFHPALYKLTATVSGKEKAECTKQFGMREFTVRGKYFYINGRPIVLRGTVENCDFPLTGYAPMDTASWLRVFRICKAFGLNHVRFHSYCPPEAAFIAADLTGVYLQPEGPSWPNHGSALGTGRPIDQYLMLETQRMVKEYGNYASFCMLACGNEPAGNWVPWVTKFVDYWKNTDARRVYTGASVGQSWAWQPHSQYHVKAGARGLDWGKRPESLSDFRSRIDTIQEPYVSHETGQWCAFPDFDEIGKYTGVNKAHNFEMFQEDLADNNMAELGHQFMLASGKLQALCYKHEIEKTLRTPGYAGFQLLALNDYSGQGTALVGVLNVFWEEKGYINANEFRKFCNATVLLARMEKFVFQNNENLTAQIEVSHFGEKPLKNATLRWRIIDEDSTAISSGQFEAGTIDLGNCRQLGTVNFPLSSIKKAQKLNLEVYFDHTGISNNWDFWVYPAALPQPDTTGIYITDEINDQTKAILNQGGKVLLLLAGKVEQGKDVVQYMTPSFWNTSWFKMRPPHTEGTLVKNHHPVFNDFPTDFYTGLQWWELIYKAQVMEMNNFPASFQPIIQPIDTWFINRKLGMLFEANIGKGKIMVCSADLRNNMEDRPVARQLYYSILKYMASNRFVPEHSLDLSLIEDLTKKEGKIIDMGTKDAPDELKNK